MLGMLTRFPVTITKTWRRTNFIKVVSSQQCNHSTANRPPFRPTENNEEQKRDEKRKRYGHTDHSESNKREDTDHFGYLQNHIWTKEEINGELKSLYRHTPVTMSDKFMNAVVSLMFFIL
jgi:ABC-type Zn2+ transport system substrate-binding protein/surface adhesin